MALDVLAAEQLVASRSVWGVTWTPKVLVA
jgi:hypothetical protein